MTEPVEIGSTSRVSSRWISSLLLVPLAFNGLHALAIIAAYRDATDPHLQIWLLTSTITLLGQLTLLFASRRRRPPLQVDERLRAADLSVLLLALLVCAMQASFLAFALSTTAFGPQRPAGFASTTGNWGRLLWAYY